MNSEVHRSLFITGFFLFLFSMILPAYSEQFNAYGFQTAIVALGGPFSAGWDSNIFQELFYRGHLLFLGSSQHHTSRNHDIFSKNQIGCIQMAGCFIFDLISQHHSVLFSELVQCGS